MLMNKKHYTYMAQWTKGKVVHWAQNIAAKAHFNWMTLIDKNEDGSTNTVVYRYGIIQTDDVLRDLEHWETLLVSSFMMRPHDVLEKGPRYD